MNEQHYDWNQSYSGDATDYEEPDHDLIEIIDHLPPGRALDIGCGAGGLAVALAERGWRTTGIDISDKAIASARAVAERRGARVEFQVADATRWRPLGDYDLITNSFALPGSRSGRDSVFEMVKGALAPGGVVILKDFDPSMKRFGFLTGFELVTVEEFTAAFQGLKIIRSEIVDTPGHDHSTGHGTSEGCWTAALLYAENRQSILSG